MAAFVSSPIHLFIVFSSNSLVRQDVTLHRTVDLANQVLQVTLSHRSGMQLFVYSWPVLKARYVLVANVSPSVVRPVLSTSCMCCQTANVINRVRLLQPVDNTHQMLSIVRHCNKKLAHNSAMSVYCSGDTAVITEACLLLVLLRSRRFS